jgi:hypothetical protein
LPLLDTKTLKKGVAICWLDEGKEEIQKNMVAFSSSTGAILV